MEEKILSQINISRYPYATRGRFASGLADITEWKRNPIFRVGKFEKTGFQIFKSLKEQHRVNGLADFLAKFGLIVFVAYILILFYSLKKINNYYL